MKEVRFPRINELEVSKVVHLPDLTIAGALSIAVIGKVQEFCATVPVIVIGHKNDMSAIEKEFNKNKDTLPVCYNLARMIGGKKPKLQIIHTTIEQEFNQKKVNGKYGVYLIDERLGRGTDFPTSPEIEASGGVLAIITNVYGSRVEQQMIARVGRLQHKGQWTRILVNTTMEMNFQKN